MMNEKSLQPPKHFIRRACELGALEAKVISPHQVFTAEWVRRKCQYGCDGFGERLTCPPYSPTPQETRRMLDEYDTALLIHCPSEEVNVHTIICALEREAFLSGYYKAFGMSAGPCLLCDTCNVHKLCRHADQARPSMEACGIDVYQTARTAGYPIEVVRNHSCAQNYYGLLLLK
jgi:predicted metal-binding protein